MWFPSVRWEHKSVNSAKSAFSVNTAKVSVKSQLIYSWYRIATKRKGFWLKKQQQQNKQKKNLPSDGRQWLLLHPKN